MDQYHAPFTQQFPTMPPYMPQPMYHQNTKHHSTYNQGRRRMGPYNCSGRGYGRGGQGQVFGHHHDMDYQQRRHHQDNGSPYHHYSHQARTPNPIKRFNNRYYCWSHGFDVDHQSHECKCKKWGHQDRATKNNIMGGSTAKQHKTQLNM